MNQFIANAAGYYLDEYDSERFWQHVRFRGGLDHESDPLATAEGECWVWDGGTGYGRFQLFGTWHQAHRVAYRDFGNKLAEELDIDHLCRNDSCVRPSHLEPVDETVNVARGLRGRAQHPNCPSGHPYSEDNTIWQPRGDREVRRCRTCLRDSRHRSYLRRKSESK